MTPLRIGLIGCGDVAASWHIPTLIKSKCAVLCALCDPDVSKISTLGMQYGINRLFDNHNHLLEQDDIDAVIVATPPWVTPMITMDALNSGKHVLCEKPMALSIDIAKQVASVEKQTGKKVQIGFTYRHDPLIIKLTEWINDGKLGSPVFSESVFTTKNGILQGSRSIINGF